MAVDADEANSSRPRIPWYQGILQGNMWIERLIQPRMSPKNMRISRKRMFPAGNLNRTDQGRVLSFQRLYALASY
jgi:hypothetical protein